MMIFDRTEQDVQEAIKIREEKVKTFQELTEDEIKILEKGTLTINTLNRIENKQSELLLMLNSMGYWNMSISNKNWEYSDVFYKNDFDRIIENSQILKEGFFVYADTPSKPTSVFYFKNINDLEKILYDIENNILDAKNNYRECNTFECGEV